MQASIESRTDELYREHLRGIHARTDRLFAWLLLAQWLAAIAAALWISPRAWAGSSSETHLHVWAAIFLGGLIVSLPVFLGFCRPGRLLTRHSVAVAQMLMGALLIHLTGGRIETHFHVFGSLAFLAFYRDWRVLITGTVVVAADHFIRGQFFPQSVFGVVTASPWRWLEHAGWVVFEDAILLQACRRGIREVHSISERQAELERTNAEIESIVATRTAEVRFRTKQLQEQKHLTEQIIETATDAFVGTDANGLITDWNRQAELTYGWSKEEAIGRKLVEVVLPPKARQELENGMQEFRATGTAFFISQRLEMLGLHRDGHQFPIELTLWPIAEVQNLRFNAFIHDISERKRAEAEMQRAKEAAVSANRAKSEFLANMSHEIRTPMNGIVGMTRLALGTDLTTVQREYLDMVSRSGDALLAIINDILDFSKIEAGKLSLDPVPFSLRDCVEDVLKEHSSRAHEKGLELTYHIATEVPDGLIGDPGRLRQILVNLVGNAIKFTEKGDVSVQVKTHSVDSNAAELQFAVRDTGIGIAPAKLATIFQPFEQADNTTTRRFGGTGLGLTISNNLVTMMGGKIEVTSCTGEGSEFHFRAGFGLTNIPVQRRPYKVLPDLRGLAVLIVDDLETNRRMLNDLLLSWKMRPFLATNGSAAIQAMKDAAAAKQPFALVLLDALMPDLDGFEVAEFIRQQPDYTRATVMMLSSADRQGDAARCRKLGVDSYLTKPVTQSDLFDAIVNALHMRASGSVCLTESAAAQLKPVSTSLNILLAEDNLINRKLAVKVLEMKGHRVATVVDGKQAVDMSARERYDLILMDIQMPEMDGMEATKAIRERERTTGGHLPIIAMTAHALKGDRERCLDCGMDGYVPKPIDPDVLWSEIAAVVPNSQVAAIASPPVPVEVEGDVLDHNRIEGLRKMTPDGSLLQELIGIFKEECPRMIADVREAIDRGDPNSLDKKAHLLKGSLMSLGAVRASSEAQFLEKLGKSGQLKDAAQRFANLDREIDRFQTALNQYSKAI